jgi:hypothetical protein
MTSVALIGAGGAAADAAATDAAGALVGAGGVEAAGVAEEADAGGGAAVAGGGAGAAAARASDAASAHAADESVAIGERAGRGTGESYRKSRGTSRANYFMHETVKVSKIHGMLAHRARSAPNN